MISRMRNQRDLKKNYSNLNYNQYTLLINLDDNKY